MPMSFGTKGMLDVLVAQRKAVTTVVLGPLEGSSQEASKMNRLGVDNSQESENPPQGIGRETQASAQQQLQRKPQTHVKVRIAGPCPCVFVWKTKAITVSNWIPEATTITCV